MRSIVCAAAMAGCLAAPCYAQNDEGPRAAYAEIGGSTIFYSLNAELPMPQNRTVRIGAMLLPHVLGATTSINQFIGRGEYRLILGLGLSVVGNGGDRLTAGTATIGYRHILPNGSFFQLAATPFITKQGVYRYMGFSIGKSY